MPTPGAQEALSFSKQITRTVTLGYLLYLPPDYAIDAPAADASRRWPLLLFLHGAGERGDDLELVKKHGPPKLLSHGESQGEHLPFVVVSPQCPADTWWPFLAEALIALLDDLAGRLAVDAERVYVTGLSMGGFGTWSLAAAQPERFAAIVPICGGGEPQRARLLRHLPTWVFHGAKDPVVPLRRSEEMVEALQAAGGDVRLTVYPEAGHDSWTETYANPALYEWLLAHRRGAR